MPMRDVDSDGDSEKNEKVTRPVFHVRKKLKTYSFNDLRDSCWVSLYAIFHAYLFWTVLCVIMAMGANVILRWWVRRYTSFIAAGHMSWWVSLGVFETLGKSWIWTSFVCEVARSCFWLGRDATRADTFELYRRTLLGEARESIEQGQLYAVSRRAASSRCNRKYWDLGLQLVMYLTLDIVPSCIAIRGFLSGERLGAVLLDVSLFLLPAACLHVLVFFSAWTLTDVYIKLTSFVKIWEAPDEDDSSDGENGELSSDRDGSDSDVDAHAAMAVSREASVEHGISEDRNLCIYFCRGCILIEVFAPHLLWFTAVVGGLALKRWEAVFAGLFCAVLICCYSAGLISSGMSWAVMPYQSPRLRALQRWGEELASLSFDAQFRGRAIPAMNFVIVANLFAFAGMWKAMLASMLIVVFIVCRQAMFWIERPLGWLFGITEGVALHVIVALLAACTQTVGQARDFFLILGLGLARIFGMRRRIADGDSVRNLSMVWLCTVQVVVLAIVIMNIKKGGATKNFSVFCNEANPNCSSTEIAYKEPSLGRLAHCSLRFPSGEHGQSLTLPDFGLFSALAYERSESVEQGLKTYFPDWHIEERHFTKSMAKGEGKEIDYDWTTFYEFTNSANTTSVFAVRGTQYLIDVLQDVDLWLPAVTIQMFEKIGPTFSEGLIDAIAELTTTGQRDTEKKAFGVLLDRVEREIRRSPGRAFYITGHSLGGGVAKLVAAKIAQMNPDVSLPAVVFAAPGLEATSYVVYGERLAPGLETKAITVRPQTDVVSRVDQQKGGTVPVSCNGTALSCHSIFNTLCSIYDDCGSMRPNEKLIYYPGCANAAI